MEIRLHSTYRSSAENAHYRQAAGLLRRAKRGVVLTGAGVSTGSGIPDFRSPGIGAWEFVDPFEVASIWEFRRRPQRFYQWIRPLVQAMRKARPNRAHQGLAQLEQAGLIQTIITQNIDDLHQQAGSRNVLCLHGRADIAICLECGRSVAGASFWEEALSASDARTVPTCSRCGGVMKPDVVLFGEELPADVLCAAQEAALDCDLMLIAGASLEVMPAADLPRLAKRAGAQLIICNLGHTMMDSRAVCLLREDVTVSIPRLVELILGPTGAAE